MNSWTSILLVLSLLGACGNLSQTPTNQSNQTKANQMEKVQEKQALKITDVSTSGSADAYSFAVTIKSADKGCEQYANWWEVTTEEGKLLYRRILHHSHVSEQPFTRSGGSVKIGAEDVVIVRGHMNNSGYSKMAYKGSVKEGFKAVELAIDFALDLEKEEPQPGECNF